MNFFKNLKSVCLIIGPNRSGSSLVRAILDAHPEMMIAHEFGRKGLYGEIASGSISREKAVDQLYQNALNKKATSQKLIYNKETGKVKSSFYDNTIRGMYQGSCTVLKVIGDKSGPWISEQVVNNPEFVKKLDSFFGVPVKYINIIRHPLDNIMSMRMGNKDYSKYFYWCDGSLIISQETNQKNYMDLYLEDLINYPINMITKLHRFLGFTISQSHMSKCRSVIFDKPHRRKSEYNFSSEELQNIKNIMKKYPFLLRYKELD